MDGWDLMVLLTTQYPQYKAIVDKPGVFDVLMQAFSSDVPWSADRISAALGNTPYFLSTSKEYRDWDINAAIDPAQAMIKYKRAQMLLADTMEQTGLKVPGELGWGEINLFGPPTEYSELIRDALAMGWDAQDMKYALMLRSSGIPSGGELSTNTMKAIRMADDYAVPLSIEAAADWGKKLTAGIVDEKGLLGYISQQAGSLFPGLTDAFSRGITVREYAEPYLQIAQTELGINPKTVSLADPKWNAALNQIDPNTGARTSMTLSDWTRKIRSDSQYGYDNTDRAKAQGASLSTALAKTMGAIG